MSNDQDDRIVNAILHGLGDDLSEMSDLEILRESDGLYGADRSLVQRGRRILTEAVQAARARSALANRTDGSPSAANDDRASRQGERFVGMAAYDGHGPGARGPARAGARDEEDDLGALRGGGRLVARKGVVVLQLTAAQQVTRLQLGDGHYPLAPTVSAIEFLVEGLGKRLARQLVVSHQKSPKTFPASWT
ncbi:MAG: hypothetical protein EPO51_08345 [Phenylobacterium sp.]|uniref:hypothetical protein n=1 Tax=Phenylobacterium sp. TaxID=1871053 RepID=UPI0012069884|nr:hypothetical protein [Phenylobacterium sp.]TAJ72118.1 MAG: hypothetical protein EPO51_08345 [Phenylobacterium sp.]